MKTKLVLLEKCLVCDLEGESQPVERLPNGGIRFRMVHSDGKIHEWGQFPSIGILLKDEKATPKLRRLVCPKCGKRGRINGFTPKGKPPSVVEYVVVHEKIAGTWGKEGKHPKQRRCYITDPEQRDTVLKKLGRYIAKEVMDK